MPCCKEKTTTLGLYPSPFTAFQEAVNPNRNIEYERTIRRLMRSAEKWETTVTFQAQKVISKLAKEAFILTAHMSGGFDSKAFKSSMEEVARGLTTELNGVLETQFTRALVDYSSGYNGFYRSIGLQGGSIRGVSKELAIVAANLTTEQVVAVTPQAISAISNQVAIAALGGQNPADAIRALASFGKAGSSFQTLGPFRTLRQRAEAVVRTELHRTFNISDEIQHKALIQEVPGTKFYWFQFSARDPRSTHARTAAASKANPIGIDEDFNVGGFPASYPHDPRLPAKEVVNCNCKKFPDFSEVDLDAIALQAARDSGEAGKQKVRAASGANAPEIKKLKKQKPKK